MLLWSDVFNGGLNFDWEYLTNNGANYGIGTNQTSIEDCDNFASFLKNLRIALNTMPGQFGANTFKIGIPVTPSPAKAQFLVNDLNPYIDEVHIMTYDFHSGGWDTISGFHTNPCDPPQAPYPTPILSTEYAVKYFLGELDPSFGPQPAANYPLPRIDPAKLFLGLAYYSRGYGNCDRPYKDLSTVPLPNLPSVHNPDDILASDYGVLPYKQIVNGGATDRNGTTVLKPVNVQPYGRANPDYTPGAQPPVPFQMYTDKQSQAGWFTDGENFYNMDNQDSIQTKCDLIKRYKLGGALVWDLSSDVPLPTPLPSSGRLMAPSNSLTYVVTQNFGSPTITPVKNIKSEPTKQAPNPLGSVGTTNAPPNRGISFRRV